MAEPAHRKWTADAFFAWQEKQSQRYELVNGYPVRMMAGARNVHDDIVVNLVGELREKVRGGGCRPFTGDGSVETGPDQIRRPDVGVDCGPREPNATKASSPRLVAEVLSPSTRDFDSYDKLDEYKNVESVQYVLLVEPNEPYVDLWSRDDQGRWSKQPINGLSELIRLPNLGFELSMDAVYEGVQFPIIPWLVHDDEPEKFAR